MQAPFHTLLESLSENTDKRTLPVVIETPKGSRNKYKYDEKLGVMVLHSVLPSGTVFPYDFGFVPFTRAEDGDPMDILVFMDQPAFPGCVLAVRVIGILLASQSEDKQTVRNDRLIGVACGAHTHGSLRSVKEMDPTLRHEIEGFFVAYHKIKGKEFDTLGWVGPTKAFAQLKSCRRRYRKEPMTVVSSLSMVLAKPESIERQRKSRKKR